MYTRYIFLKNNNKINKNILAEPIIGEPVLIVPIARFDLIYSNANRGHPEGSSGRKKIVFERCSLLTWSAML